jgi:hypothetical protein
METLIKNRKFMWVAAAILATIYFAPSLINSVRLAVIHRQIADAATKAAKPSPSIGASIPGGTAAPVGGQAADPAMPGTPASQALSPVANDPSLSKFVGTWENRLAIPNRGTCNLKIEIKNSADEKYPLSGYSTLSCMPSMLDLMARNHATKPTPAEAIAAMTNQMNPTSAILKGNVQNGSAQFVAVKNIGVDEIKDGCPMVSITVTPFAEQVAAEWKESQQGTCQGGQMLMRKL